MKITGELLKSERLLQNLSTQDVSASLKISSRTVQSIENGSLDELPAKTYVRGFVKSYAEFLKMDSSAILKQFHEEVGITHPVSKNAIQNTSIENTPTSPSVSTATKKSNSEISTVTPHLKNNLNKNTFKIVGLIIILVLLLGGINEVIKKYQNEAKTSEDIVSSSDEIATSSNLPKVVIPAQTEDSTVVTKIPKSETVEIQTTIPKTESSDTENMSTSNKNIELVIESLKDTTIQYAVGDETEFKTLDLKKDTFQIIKSKKGLRLKSNEGNSINITVNGVNKGLASKDAKPVQISY